MARAPVRSVRERLIQTLWFEGLGLVLVSPLYSWLAGSSMQESIVLLIVLSSIVTAWSALYNTGFDHLEWRWARRVASSRPAPIRALHAIGFEASAVLLTWPVIQWMTGIGWWPALLADLGLTLTYIVYGYAFHWVFDKLRPVRA